MDLSSINVKLEVGYVKKKIQKFEFFYIIFNGVEIP